MHYPFRVFSTSCLVQRAHSNHLIFTALLWTAWSALMDWLQFCKHRQDRSPLNLWKPCTAQHCTVLLSTNLHLTTIQSTVLLCNELTCTLLHFTGLNCTVMYITALHWRVWHSKYSFSAKYVAGDEVTSSALPDSWGPKSQLDFKALHFTKLRPTIMRGLL